ncbi:tripartite tricarboxylate transporter substrate binding protein [Variovorax sp. NFACC27]|uniref:Bug family tripartite tricarboxylate transporter substrate binding protein n=1 Tax=unclassified Variovorax TaxID=663243 RepID=UPI000896A824|nr:Tripartite-type tricarboxylate transporter, receptor component TctC [Variovorax sp. NFACC28]SEG88152.1 Tripartite-type tricarboxylate transporter, receptor component TctC [Variovorax sp. NFACC29]SFD26230.1 Tripartite-type tricarboxylate transporter, receptor component TctC [Variovorax sp. NFACC26]SFG35627.1 Tripartite-type tricarboxylate transporter, receptor component TctC [Variovorax sp. NFACC27]
MTHPTLPLRRCLLWLAAAALVAPAHANNTNNWPAKPIKVIVNFPAGGAADQIARAISQPLQESLKQPVVIENRAGANGNVGGEAVARAPADGYTLLMSSGGMVSVNPHLYSRMSFDPAKDLVPVAAAARVLVFLVTRPSLPPANVKEFISYVKANPGKLTYGSPGSGSSPHLAGEMFKTQANLFALHVPYRGAAPALQDLLAGQIDYAFDPGIALTQVRAGKLRLLAVGSPKRSPLFPDVPTLDEAGLRGFDADTVFGFYAPVGTPPEVVAQLNTQINRALALPAVQERIASIGGEAQPGSPAAFQQRAAADSQRFGALIRERRIVAD